MLVGSGRWLLAGLAGLTALTLAGTADHGLATEPLTEVTSDAVQTFYQNGVPHTDRTGRVTTSFQPGSSFLPIGMYYPQPCVVGYGFSWPAFEGDPDFDGDGEDDWDNTYQLLINLGSTFQEGDRIEIRNLTRTETSSIEILLPADTDLFYRVFPNPYQKFINDNPEAPPLAQGTFNVPCPENDNDDPNLVQTLAEGGFNQAIILTPLHPQILIDLKKAALNDNPNNSSVENFGFVIDAREGRPSFQGFAEQLFAPIAEGGQGYSQHPDIYGWQLEDEPLVFAANTSPGCDPVLLQDALDRLRKKYDDHKDATDQVIFLVEGRPDAASPLCGSFPQWDDSVRVGDAGNHDHYLKRSDQPIASVKPIADTVKRQTNALSELEPSWFTTQAFSLRGHGFPTAAQTRAAVYTAIVHGATGIWYFMFDSWLARTVNLVGVRPTIPESYPESQPFGEWVADSDTVAQGQALWTAITELNEELASLENVILQPTSTQPYRVFVSGQTNSWSPIRTMLKSVGNDHYLFAVNMDDAQADAAFDFGRSPSAVDVLFEDRQVTGGVLSDHFEPFDVHVYRLQFPDSDSDGIDDFVDNCLSVPNPAQTDQDMDGIGLGCDPNDMLVDADWDGCSDVEEQGSNPAVGGQRDPTNFWDFFDTPNPSSQRDKAVTIPDIVRVLHRYGTSDENGTAPINRNSEPLSTPPETGYHPAYDRGTVVGPNPWNLGPANGSVDIGDLIAVLYQYGHSCAGPPP